MGRVLLLLPLAAVVAACGGETLPQPAAKAIARLRLHGGMGLFPAHLGTIRCRLVEGGPYTAHPRRIPARCTTDVRKRNDGFVLTFTETWRARDFEVTTCYDKGGLDKRCTRFQVVKGSLHHRYEFFLNRAGFSTKERQSGDPGPEQVG